MAPLEAFHGCLYLEPLLAQTRPVYMVDRNSYRRIRLRGVEMK